jgi:aromatic-L-amino-acid decarboxylase
LINGARRRSASKKVNKTPDESVAKIEGESATTDTALDPGDWNGFRQQSHRMLDDMLRHMETLRTRPVWQIIPDEVRAKFCQSMPQGPMELFEVHEEFMTSIVPYTSHNAHPGFLGWVQGGGTPVGMLAEMLAAGLNANLGGRDQVPLDVEHQVTEWMRTLFGFPTGSSGLFVTGTSMANFIAIVVARKNSLGSQVRQEGVQQQSERLTAYASTAVHGSIGRALDFAGLGSDSLRLVPVDRRQRMDLQALAERVAADRISGFTPFLVVGTAGTVDTGSIDDLAGIADFCAEENLWFHVDGAYGALAMLAPDLAPRLIGIEKADSLAFDFHKWAQVPYDAGFILIRDGVLQQQAFSSSGAYLGREERGMSAGSPWPCDFGPDLSRGFRALKTWMTLKVYGAEAIGKVISHSCELANYLKMRIASTPELELVAAAELNVVCFRYKLIGSTSSGAIEDQVWDRLNSQIVIALQESGAVAPSTTRIGGRVAIRAAIVNHRTRGAEIDTLVEAVLVQGRMLSQVHVSAPGSSCETWFAREARVRQLSEQLNFHTDADGNLPAEVEVRFRLERATLLAHMGRDLEARCDYLRVLALDPLNLQNMADLGRLLVRTGRLKAAELVYTEAVRLFPESILCRVNLGGTLLEQDQNAAAREQYEAALLLDPDFPQAHGGMYYALSRLGELNAAQAHWQIAFAWQSVFAKPYRGAAQPIPVLLLVSSTGGNTPIEKLLDDRVFQTYVIVADFYNDQTPLPDHQLVINGIGDVDTAKAALVAAEAFVTLTAAPVINAPKAVLATSRASNSHRLGALPGVLAPRTCLLSQALLAGPDGPSVLAHHGLTFPLLLRAPGFHMGKHFVRVESADLLADAVAELPGEQILAIEYFDARGSDGYARKYRVMMVDGRLYPLHLAISPYWKIHYFSAEMADKSENRSEEARFLDDMPNVLGATAMRALKQIQIALNLDYAGIDFGLSPRGEVLFFEANATMVVQQPDEGQRWNYRRAAVERIQAAVVKMLLDRAGSANSIASTDRDAAWIHPASLPVRTGSTLNSVSQ